MQTLRKQDGGQTKCKSRKRQNLKCDFYAPLKVQVFHQKSEREREREKHFFKLKRQKIKFNKTFFKKMGNSRPPFLYFRLFNAVDSKQMFDKSLPKTGFESRISGVRGDRSTTELQPLPN